MYTPYYITLMNLLDWIYLGDKAIEKSSVTIPLPILGLIWYVGLFHWSIFPDFHWTNYAESASKIPEWNENKEKLFVIKFQILWYAISEDQLLI